MKPKSQIKRIIGPRNVDRSKKEESQISPGSEPDFRIVTLSASQPPQVLSKPISAPIPAMNSQPNPYIPARQPHLPSSAVKLDTSSKVKVLSAPTHAASLPAKSVTKAAPVKRVSTSKSTSVSSGGLPHKKEQSGGHKANVVKRPKVIPKPERQMNATLFRETIRYDDEIHAVLKSRVRAAYNRWKLGASLDTRGKPIEGKIFGFSKKSSIKIAAAIQEV